MTPKKTITEPQAALLRYLLREGWDLLPFFPLDIFPQRNNAHNANRRMLTKLAEAGCLQTDPLGRYTINLQTSRAALEAYPP